MQWTKRMAGGEKNTETIVTALQQVDDHEGPESNRDGTRGLQKSKNNHRRSGREESGRVTLAALSAVEKIRGTPVREGLLSWTRAGFRLHLKTLGFLRSYKKMETLGCRVHRW